MEDETVAINDNSYEEEKADTTKCWLYLFYRDINCFVLIFCWNKNKIKNNKYNNKFTFAVIVFSLCTYPIEVAFGSSLIMS